jgi:hypothetical protein
MAELTIYKYPFEIQDYVELALPHGAELLHVDFQREVPCLWALVDPKAPLTRRRIRVAGTGHPIEEAANNLQFEVDLRSANSEVKEYRDMTDRRREEVQQLEKTNADLNSVRVSLYRACIQERTDLVGRILRIDQRIRALGFRAPDDPEGPEANRA